MCVGGKIVEFLKLGGVVRKNLRTYLLAHSYHNKHYCCCCDGVFHNVEGLDL